ncbi:hypothetical protein Tco_0564614 [Tanacetum coccineum]
MARLRLYPQPGQPPNADPLMWPPHPLSQYPYPSTHHSQSLYLLLAHKFPNISFIRKESMMILGMMFMKGSCKRIGTSYGMKRVIVPSPQSTWLSSQETGWAVYARPSVQYCGRDGSEVGSANGVVECGKVTLVSDVSKGSDSSSERGVAGGSLGKGVNTVEPRASSMGVMVYVSVGADEEDIDL